MTLTTITIDRLQSFQISLNVAAQIALDLDLVVADRVNDFVDLLRREILGPQIRVDVCLLENPPRSRKADPVNVG